MSGAYCIIDKSVYANATYTCPSGYSLSGSNCIKKVVALTHDPSKYENLSETIKSSYYNSFSNNCSTLNGEVVRSNGIYYCYDIKTTNSSITYDCKGKEGTLAGDSCVNVVYEDAYAFPSCPDGGYLISDTQCRLSIDATKK